MNRKRSDIMERRSKLLELIRQAREGELNVEQTAARLKVSAVTLRRDLALLEEEGLVRRAYGRVTPVEKGPEPESFSPDLTPADSVSRIARLAAGFVENGDVIFINTSRTALRMLRFVEAENVTVITNNTMAVNVPRRDDMTIVLTGGELRYPKYAMVGAVAQQSLRFIQANKAFLGCGGLSVGRGVTTEHFAEVAVDQVMLTSVSGPVYLLAAHNKLGKDANFSCGEIRLIRELVTDRDADPEQLRALQEAGVVVHLA